MVESYFQYCTPKHRVDSGTILERGAVGAAKFVVTARRPNFKSPIPFS